ncbi:hypothetical protein C2S53_004408 [Perilla frutescens var. hirtella]|uniref:Uncharacterized protein n=1 Tax=Perilla frutescens var. hirtella TaxID=608512 RepID=A0AAD4NWV9_PERFH|nr:hypothetical protein C2S53_004408 [Perilla frutescens var. hirtella]
MASGSSFDVSNFLDDDAWEASITEQNQRVDRIIEDMVIHAAELSLQPTNHHRTKFKTRAEACTPRDNACAGTCMLGNNALLLLRATSSAQASAPHARTYTLTPARRARSRATLRGEGHRRRPATAMVRGGASGGIDGDGMKYATLDSLFEDNQEHARRVGFSVVKRINRKVGEDEYKYALFVCSKFGKPTSQSD